MSTEERRMDCRMYVEAEVGKKVSVRAAERGAEKYLCCLFALENTP